jgi:hypothetical protein
VELASETVTAEGVGFMVNRDTVVQIGAAFAAEATRLRARLDEHRVTMRTEPALGDPASADFAAALNEKLVDGADSYLSRAQAYADELDGVAEQCAQAARDYGFTDEQIQATMRGIGGCLA